MRILDDATAMLFKDLATLICLFHENRRCTRFARKIFNLMNFGNV